MALFFCCLTFILLISFVNYTLLKMWVSNLCFLYSMEYGCRIIL